MNKKLVNKLKEKLKEMEKGIEKELETFAQKGEAPNDWKTKFPHWDGEAGSGALERMADEVEEYESFLALERKLEKKLKEIKEALTKIEKGNYGICEKCGKEIEINRLETIPETKFCQKCKK